MCNFIGCPDGKIPIDDAMNVMCDSDPCSVEQCCMANCSFHPCPNNFIPILMASETMCPTSGCTTALCCSKFFYRGSMFLVEKKISDLTTVVSNVVT